ncbi:MAG: hypothetical protein ACK4UY_16770, partial [Dietzia sp.]
MARAGAAGSGGGTPVISTPASGTPGSVVQRISPHSASGAGSGAATGGGSGAGSGAGASASFVSAVTGSGAVTGSDMSSANFASGSGQHP